MTSFATYLALNFFEFWLMDVILFVRGQSEFILRKQNFQTML